MQLSLDLDHRQIEVARQYKDVLMHHSHPLRPHLPHLQTPSTMSSVINPCLADPEMCEYKVMNKKQIVFTRHQQECNKVEIPFQIKFIYINYMLWYMCSQTTNWCDSQVMPILHFKNRL